MAAELNCGGLKWCLPMREQRPSNKYRSLVVNSTAPPSHRLGIGSSPPQSGEESSPLQAFCQQPGE